MNRKLGRPKGRPNVKKYKRMSPERHCYLMVVQALIRRGKSFAQAQRLAKEILKH